MALDPRSGKCWADQRCAGLKQHACVRFFCTLAFLLCAAGFCHSDMCGVCWECRAYFVRVLWNDLARISAASEGCGRGARCWLSRLPRAILVTRWAHASVYVRRHEACLTCGFALFYGCLQLAAIWIAGCCMHFISSMAVLLAERAEACWHSHACAPPPQVTSHCIFGPDCCRLLPMGGGALHTCVTKALSIPALSRGRVIILVWEPVAAVGFMPADAAVRWGNTAGLG